MKRYIATMRWSSDMETYYFIDAKSLKDARAQVEEYILKMLGNGYKVECERIKLAPVQIKPCKGTEDRVFLTRYF